MAANDEGKSYYGLGLDNSQLQADARRASNILKGIGDSAEAEGSRIDNAYKSIAAAVSGYFTLNAAKSFISDIIKVRSEFQNTEAMFKVFLGDADKAASMMQKLQKYAFNNVFEFKDLTQQSAQLLAYGTSAEKVITVLDKLSNIAAGVNQPLERFVELYNKAQSKGKLDQIDLQQWSVMGDVVSYLADMLGKSREETRALISEGKVGFKEMDQLLTNLTSSGGRFSGMMEEKMKTLGDSIGLLQDSITNMFNEIGEKTQDYLRGGILFANTIVENYEKIGKAIADIVVAYGAYKAALITLNAVQTLNKRILQEALLIKQLNRMEVAKGTAGVVLMSNAEAVAAAQTKLLSLAQNGLVKALNAAKAAMLANPYTLVAVAVATLVFGIYKLVTAESAAEAAQRKHNEAMEAAKEKKENLISKTQQLTNKINDETQTIYAQIKAWKELQKEMPEAFGKMTMTEFKNMKPDERDRLINKTADDREIAEINKAMDDAQKRVEALKKSINDAVSTPSLNGSNGGYIMVLGRQLKEAEETLRLKTEEKKLRDEIIRQAEFESKPDSEKLNILNKQLQKYRDQYTEIEKLVPESERVADSMNKAVTPSILNVEKGLFGVNTEWGKFDWQTQANISQLNFLNGKINEVSNTISAITAANGQGMTYAEAKSNAMKAYEDAKKLVADITKNSKNYTQKAYEDAASDLEAKKKAYQALGGDTTVKQKTQTTKPRDYSEQIEREKQEMTRLYKDLEFSVEQARIDAMDKGAEKILAQNELNYKKEVEQITRQKEDLLKQIQEQEKTIWESQNPDREKKGMKFTPKTTQLSETDENPFKAISKGAEARFVTDNKKAYEDALKDYADFAKNYLDKVKEFDDNIKNLEKQGTSAEIIAGVKTMQAEILSGLDEEMNMKETTFVTFVEGMVGMGLEQLLAALQTAKEALQTELSSGGNDKEKVTKLQAKVKSLTDQINKLSAEKEEKPDKTDPTKKWAKMIGVMKDVKDATNDVIDTFDGFDDATKEILNSAINISTGVINMIIGIQTLAVGAAAATTATATTASAAISTVEKASVILAIISAAIQVVMAIVNVVKQFFNNDKKKEKEIQRLQGQVDTLKDAYEKLGKAIEKAYSSNAKKLIEQQDANLRQQKKIIEEQIRLEEDKKKTDKNKVQQYKDALKDIDDELEKTHDRVIEALIGEDISSAIDDFAEAYVDAWAAGEDKAASMKEVVRKMVKSAITELIKSRLSPEVQAFMEYLATAMEDGILTIAEQNALDALEASIYNKLNGLDSSLDKYVKDKQDEAREASSKGFASMSQDSANELNGKFTAFTALTYSIAENMKILIANSTQVLKHLAGIESNTESCRRLDGMDADMKAIKDSINDIVLKGLLLKKQ